MNEPGSQSLPNATVRTWIMTTAVVGLIPLSYLLAYTMPDPENGFAAAATAAVFFLGGHALALMVAIGNAVHAFVCRAALSTPMKWMAWLSLLVAPVSVGVLFALAALRG